MSQSELFPVPSEWAKRALITAEAALELGKPKTIAVIYESTDFGSSGSTQAKEYAAKKGLKVVADEAYLTESMMDPLAKIHVGYAPIMPSFLGQLSGGDVAAIVEYIRSLR